jgi:phenylpropionate dioxygenase-like ring-hydroxylating dioxygenase large terminal subunit
MSAGAEISAGADAPLFLRDLWYMAGFARNVRKGQLRRVILLGEPVAIGRMADGSVFALRDICPHRGVPLSAGRVENGTVECPYHGWRFRADGVCAAIPSLVDGQEMDPSKIRVRAYNAREQDGLIWIFMPSKDGNAPKSAPPKVGVPDARPRWSESQTFACAIDHAVIGLMDPAHAPYVHGRWWWKVTPRVKEKHYAPLPTGFVMTRHEPSKAAYKFLGDVTTEITFELPGVRFENIRGFIGGRQVDVVGLTTCTPIDSEATQVTQVFYWPSWLGFLKPFFWAFGRTFLSDDRKMVELQREGLKFNPSLMLIQDSDVPAMWYHRLKKTWAESTASGAPFVNPLKERVLKWRS